MNYILIDYENVQPKDLAELPYKPTERFQLEVIIGAKQKIPDDLTKLAKSKKYLEYPIFVTKLGRVGKNVLDLHIAYLLGFLTETSRGNGVRPHRFYIISKDKNYDPLIKYLLMQRHDVERLENLLDVPCLSGLSDREEHLSTIVGHLLSMSSSRPRKVKTLKNTINSLFDSKLEPNQIDQLVKRLEQQKYIAIVNNDAVNYPEMPSRFLIE